MNIQEIRQKYPQYKDLSDDQLAKSLHAKFYADMPYDQFAAKAGISSGSGDVVKSIGAAIPKGLAAAYGLPADIAEGVGSVAEFAAAKIGGVFGIPEEKFYGLGKTELPLPTSERLKKAIPKAISHEPKTEAGKRAGAVTEFLSGGVGLGGKSQALPSLLAGLGSEGAGMLTNDNPYAKMAGAFIAPAGVAVHQAYRSTPGQMVREAAGPMTPQQIAEAQAKMNMARQQGVNLTGPEVMPPSAIQQLQADVASSPSGGRILNEFMSKRPEQVRAAVDSGLLSRVGAAATPDVNMARAKEAATDVIRGAEKARSAAVKPHYQAARGDIVPPENIQAIISQIDNALPNLSPESRAAAEAFKRSIADTNPTAAALDDLYKSTRNKIDLPPIGATPEQRTAAGVLGPFNASLDDSLKLSSDNIKQGREQYRQITERVINPLTSGPVGRVAGKQGFDPALPENLNPISAVANEKIARPESIRELYTHLNKQDPQAFPGIARTWLENAFDQSAQTIQAGKNRMVGANFAKAVYGTPQQEANFIETMKGVAKANGQNPDEVAKGAKNLLEILQLTGKVPGTGSPTGGRIAANEMAASSGAASAAESLSASPLTGVARKLRQWAQQGNYKALAEAMTAPDSVERLAKMARYNPQTATSQYLAAGILGLNESGQ